MGKVDCLLDQESSAEIVHGQSFIHSIRRRVVIGRSTPKRERESTMLATSGPEGGGGREGDGGGCRGGGGRAA